MCVFAIVMIRVSYKDNKRCQESYTAMLMNMDMFEAQPSPQNCPNPFEFSTAISNPLLNISSESYSGKSNLPKQVMLVGSLSPSPNPFF